MKIAENIGRVMGPTPGPKGAVKQHHAMASGYALPKPARKVKVPGLPDRSTGCSDVPGLAGSYRKGS